MHMSNLEFPETGVSIKRKNKSLPKSSEIALTPIADPKLQRFAKKAAERRNEGDLSFLRHETPLLSSTVQPDEPSLESTIESSREMSSKQRTADGSFKEPNTSSILAATDLNDVEISLMESSGDRSLAIDVVESYIVDLANTTILDEDIDALDGENDHEKFMLEKFNEHHEHYVNVQDIVNNQLNEVIILKEALKEVHRVDIIMTINQDLFRINQLLNHFIQIAAGDIRQCSIVRTHELATPELIEVIDRIEHSATYLYQQLCDSIRPLIDYMQDTMRIFYQTRDDYRRQMSEFCFTQSHPDSTPDQLAQSDVNYINDRLNYKIELAKYYNELGSNRPLFALVPQMPSKYGTKNQLFTSVCMEEYDSFNKILM